MAFAQLKPNLKIQKSKYEDNNPQHVSAFGTKTLKLRKTIKLKEILC